MPKGGFDCYLLDRQAIEVLLRLDEKNSSLSLQVLWIGFKSDNVYFHRKDREVGESRWTFSKKFKLVVDSMMSFSYFPIKFMSGFGVVMAILAFIWIIEVFIEFFVTGAPVRGWSTLMCLVLFSTAVKSLHADFCVNASRESKVLQTLDGLWGGIGDIDEAFVDFHFESFTTGFVNVWGFHNGEG